MSVLCQLQLRVVAPWLLQQVVAPWLLQQVITTATAGTPGYFWPSSASKPGCIKIGAAWLEAATAECIARQARHQKRVSQHSGKATLWKAAMATATEDPSEAPLAVALNPDAAGVITAAPVATRESTLCPFFTVRS